MSNVRSFVIAMSLLLALAACGQPAAPVEVTRIVQVEVTRLVEVEVTRQVLTEVTRVVPPTPTDAPPPTATLEPPTAGTMDAPVPIGVPADVVMRRNDGDYEATVTVLEAVRGVAAWQMARAAHPTNEPPPDGYEYIVARIDVAYHDGPGALDMGGYYTSTITDNRIIDHADLLWDSPCCFDPPFEFQLLPGGSAAGWTVFLAAVGDPSPVMWLRDADGYFALTE